MEFLLQPGVYRTGDASTLLIDKFMWEVSKW